MTGTHFHLARESFGPGLEAWLVANAGWLIGVGTCVVLIIGIVHATVVKQRSRPARPVRPPSGPVESYRSRHDMSSKCGWDEYVIGRRLEREVAPWVNAEEEAGRAV